MRRSTPTFPHAFSTDAPRQARKPRLTATALLCALATVATLATVAPPQPARAESPADIPPPSNLRNSQRRAGQQSVVKHRFMDMYMPQSAGMGGAYRAYAANNDALYLNPAGMSQASRYNVALNYTFNPFDTLHVGNISIVDSETAAPLAGGFAFTYYNNRENGGDLSGFRVDGGISYQVHRMVLIGATVRYQNVSAPLVPTWNDVTADLGFLFPFSEYFSLALVGNNLIPYGDDHAPIRSAVALRTGYPKVFALTFDFQQDYWTVPGEVRFIYQAGTEFTFSEWFPFRVGYINDRVAERQYFTAGFSFVSPYFGIDFAYRQRVEDPLDDRAFYIGVPIFIN